mmetsp:Transcript_2981/g.7620  ORF Transcript_2981/g.7620 Transcript_2981/m.7620 type:complete len:264 (+) Transcript_2981:102-893(+)
MVVDNMERAAFQHEASRVHDDEAEMEKSPSAFDFPSVSTTYKSEDLNFADFASNSSSASEIDDKGAPSIGSISHDSGLCRPCAFVNSKVGCRNDAFCSFCHVPHHAESKRRPCKAKRDRVRRFVVRMENMIEDNPDAFAEDCPFLLPSIEHSSFLREKVMTRLRNKAELCKSQAQVREGEAQQLAEAQTLANTPYAAEIAARLASMRLNEAPVAPPPAKYSIPPGLEGMAPFSVPRQMQLLGVQEMPTMKGHNSFLTVQRMAV